MYQTGQLGFWLPYATSLYSIPLLAELGNNSVVKTTNLFLQRVRIMYGFDTSSQHLYRNLPLLSTSCHYLK